MTTSSNSALIATLTPAERAAGRFLRAPDHGEGGEGSDAGTDAGDTNQDNQGAGADAGDASDGDKGADGQTDGDQGKDDDAKGDEGDKSNDADKGDESASLPEKYELAAPEGFVIDDGLLAAADPVFRDLGLDNDAANKLMPLIPQFAEKLVAAQNDAFQAMKSDWAKEAKADPVLGGSNWGETENLVARALDTAAAKLPAIKGEDGKDISGADQIADFRTLLDETGLGNHRTLMRVLRFYGAAAGEGGPLVRSDSAAAQKGDRLSTLYPNDVPKEAAE